MRFVNMKHVSFVVLALAAGCATSSAVAAGSKWNGAGWYKTVQYVTLGEAGGKFIVAGPIVSKSECLKTLHPDYTSPGYDEEDPDTFHDYECENLPSRPAWD